MLTLFKIADTLSVHKKGKFQGLLFLRPKKSGFIRAVGRLSASFLMVY
ncbi:hypothetical protein GPUN_1809 [Glaciecola punicea ACAM 611]|uniref:Uncharacterized protein n=1 Tax=Glaciecola punicea ACAM 611 TaxID=1121923 RepID=H5TC98_9ALTE|nr:hypothetical protein GPUN_1809 [Glaciecola punicea ACAM 611]